ncbi:LPO_1073/Vpar_1526 family protein [Pseudomonas spirodelae]|uniref:LPO_1073/Vpar_1526 family protein n=1 Tax=Pseudomonas spirodelae TaxID=3101751 RepID=A0ABU5P7V8_9PSED|nr:LPO_1073/Vpar_1526 family protein [Pseudomonas sp. T5W1]MEA1605754.1 LPO_1073/Vpar_1526 family protein [Pseudomonas sp. T5W1]
MIGGEQNQDLNGDGMAVQAARDANVKVEKHYHGLQIAEVETLVQLFLERQLPALREEALLIMRQNADEFLRQFSAQLAKTDKVTHDAFAKPDSQICFQDALKASAEKGDQIDLSLLAEMVIGRLESDENPLLKLIYEDALRIQPRLTGPQIAFLIYHIWMRRIRHNQLVDTGQLESIAIKLFSIVKDGLAISEVNREYLASVGVITINHVSDADTIFGTFIESYPFLPKSREALQAEAPVLFSLIEAWGKHKHPLCHLNGSGKLIGLMGFQKVHSMKLDVTIWIN